MSNIDPLFEAILERDIKHLVSCGPRITFNLLVEVADHTGELIFILDRLSAYRRFPAGVVRAVGGDQFPPRSLRIVPRCPP